MSRYIAAIATFFVVWMLTPTAWADEPDWCHDGYLCIDDETARRVRDKARGFDLLCSQIDPPSALPARLATLCDEPSGASRIWAQAQATEKAQRVADELQRKVNMTKGRVSELERSNRRLQNQLADVGGKLAVEQKRKKAWRAIASGAVGVAVVSGVGLVGDVVGWWEL